MNVGTLARLRTKRRARHAVLLRLLDESNCVASWGAALRTGAAGSKDESRYRAIHMQRP